ncbi:MAG TPA: ATP-binding cassette domain-containing protein [Candidatus Limnocylindrales bacterium]|nr:ATP-binding cassette domain-containing protein [Candidatus Limnocylindrales bacterium]
MPNSMRAATTPGAAPLLTIRDLVVVRGGRQILVVDEFTVHERETLAIVGPNGAGKSTLLLVLAGLLRPDRGTIQLRGDPVVPTQDLAYRRRIGLVLPAPLLLSTSVYGNVAAGLRFRGVGKAETRERVEHWLERLAILHLRDRPASQLSSGEAQRTSLARALVLDPDVLFLDEPFVALDSRTRAALLDDFERIGDDAAATRIIVTHHLHEAVRLGDRLAILLAGSIRQCDTPARLEAAPADEEVASIMAAEARVRGHIVASEDGLVVVDTGAGSREDVEGRARRLLDEARAAEQGSSSDGGGTVGGA